MGSPLHSKQTPNDGIHTPISWTFTSTANRESFNASTGSPITGSLLTSSLDVNKLALQTDDNTLWLKLFTGLNRFVDDSLYGDSLEAGGDIGFLSF